MTSLKLCKPRYDSAEKVYWCEIAGEPPRFELRYDLDHPERKQDPSNIVQTTYAKLCIQKLVSETKGWFSKPLTEEWLIPRVKHTIQTPEVNLESWEGTIVWMLKDLLISKETFLFKWTIESCKEQEKVVIDLEDDETKSVNEDLLPVQNADPMSIGPTRRILQKQTVLKARARAARALFKAEQLTLEYCKVYGEDTDWEDESDEDDGSA